MATYTAYITYTICDTIEVEADNYDEAYEIAESEAYNNPNFQPLHTWHNSTYGWDGFDISLDTDPDPVVD